MPKKKDKTAEAAAMFAITSMSSEEVSAASQKDSNFIDSKIKEIQNEEIEKIHEEEISEAKELGIEDTLIVESTTNEITKDLERQLDESRNRYLEVVEEKNNLKEEIEKLKKENQKLTSENKISQQTILSLSSDFNCFKVDSSRELTDRRIEIDSLKEEVEVYKYNEANYKIEISNLKAALANIERNNTLSKQQNMGNSSIPLQTMYQPNPTIKNTHFSSSKNNGYASWN